MCGIIVLMNTFLQAMKAMLTETDRINFRDRRGHYPSANLSCLRDQYWAWKGEPETNKTDFTGAMRMLIGDAVEKILIERVLRHLHFVGWHPAPVQSQIPVGQSNPNWDGFLDYLMYKKTETGWDKFAVEIKTKSGYGADLFFQKPEPSQEYLIQIGLYLKNLHDAGETNHGVFIYVLLSDNHFGEIVTINCYYDEKTNSVYARDYEKSNGEAGSLEASANLTEALERWKKLDEHIKNNTVPAGEYKYKYELTPEVLREMPDAKLKKLVEGNIIYGDWQPLYSRYKNKQLLIDGIVPERTEAEIALARAEYRRRHPRSKL